MKNKTEARGVFALNKRARYDYSILETLEAGIVLKGTETKSIKTGGKVHFKDAYIRLINQEFYLVNCYITPYAFGTHENHDATRSRKLLLHKKEGLKLWQKTQEKGLSLIPLNFHSRRHIIKLEIGLGKGKKQYEKREDLKKKNLEREMSRSLSSDRIKI
jgi:SsrA-binding protein